MDPRPAIVIVDDEPSQLAQAWLFGAKYALAREVAGLTVRGDERIVKLSDGREISCRAVLIATGAAYRRLGVPSLARFEGAGVFYTVSPDTRAMRGHDAFVIGSGNSAGQAVAHLAKHARHVTLLVRGDSLEAHMSDYLVQEIRRARNVEVRLHTDAVGGEGQVQLERLTLRDRVRGTTETVPAEVLFVLIGATPRTEWLSGVVRRDDHGFVLTGRDLDDVALARLAAGPTSDAVRDEPARRVRRRRRALRLGQAHRVGGRGGGRGGAGDRGVSRDPSARDVGARAFRTGARERCSATSSAALGAGARHGGPMMSRFVVGVGVGSLHESHDARARR